VADPAVFADDGRAFDHHAILDHGAFADENLFADVGAAFAFVPQFGFQIRGEVAFDFLEGIPGEFAPVENRGVSGLVEVKQVGWFEHGGRLMEFFGEQSEMRGIKIMITIKMKINIGMMP
jgi:hypothetical protein